MRLFPLLVLSLPLAAASPPTLLDILSDELQRNFSVLKEKADPPPYYMAYTVTEEETQVVTASLGAVNGQHNEHLALSRHHHPRGQPEARQLSCREGQRARFTSGAIIPLDDVPDAIRRRVWLETDRTYRLAARRLIEIKSNAQLKSNRKTIRMTFRANRPPFTRSRRPGRILRTSSGPVVCASGRLSYATPSGF